jgi:anaerobic selenocysteine-containing dehydrogenase
MAINTLNWLIGNTDRKGGASAGGSYSEGSPPFNGAKAVPLGPRIDRAGKNHTDVPTFFAAGPDGGRTPTKRAWFPFAQNGNFQEMVPSIGAQYPYACKALITQWNVWPYSVPGGKDVARAVVLDTAKVPLHVAIDVQLGELSALADYVLPEVTFLETFATPHIAPTILQKEGTTRIPVVGRYLTTGGYKDVSEVTDFSTIVAGSEATAVWGPTPYFVPILPETRTHADILLHLMIGPEGISPANDAAASTTDPTKLGGLGANAFGPNDHLYTAWDFFKKLFTNYATANPPLALSTPGSDQVSNMLLRGGRFDDGDGTSGDLLANKFGSTSAPKIIHLYVEDLAKKVNSQTGEKDWTPLAAYEAVKDARGNAVVDAEFPFQLVTFKVSWHGQGRTVVNPTLMSIAPENSIWINAADAAAMRIVLGDRVRLTSPSNATGVVGRAFVTQGIAPGVVAVSHHFGHWELFSRPHVVSGVVTEFDRRRAGGITINPILRLDPVFGDVALQDYIGGSVSFYDTRVKVEKA